MKRILLIDDEEGIRTVWKRFHDLAEPVFRGQLDMDVSATLEHGLARMKATSYDALILDLALPPVTQDEMISWIFEHSQMPEMPLISVLTGDQDIYVRRRCLVAGAADFWVKTDAIERPDLFFKALYNAYLRRYATDERTAA